MRFSSPRAEEEKIQMTLHSSSSERPTLFHPEYHSRTITDRVPSQHSPAPYRRSDSSEERPELDPEIPHIYAGELQLRVAGRKENVHCCLAGNGFLQLSGMRLSLLGLQQVKIYPGTPEQQPLKMKVTHEQIVVEFGLQLKRRFNLLPQHFTWFAKLINSRVSTQVKRRCSLKSGTALHDNGIFNQGFILKRSKYRKKWQRRFVLINKQGLYSYRSQQDSYSLFIPAHSLNQLWTHFQLEEGCLVVKLRHCREKTEFGIPIVDFCVRSEDNWLFSLYRMMMETRVHIKI